MGNSHTIEVYALTHQSQLNTYMRKFKEFLENYDVYLDKPMGFKKSQTEDEVEETDDAQTAQEEQANEVRK